jgi:hypothetical protein
VSGEEGVENITGSVGSEEKAVAVADINHYDEVWTTDNKESFIRRNITDLEMCTTNEGCSVQLHSIWVKEGWSGYYYSTGKYPATQWQLCLGGSKICRA